jgi:hypothetical protein
MLPGREADCPLQELNLHSPIYLFGMVLNYAQGQFCVYRLGGGGLLTSFATISFSRRTLRHGINCLFGSTVSSLTKHLVMSVS